MYVLFTKSNTFSVLDYFADNNEFAASCEMF
jgi:hypothetical protein